MIYKSLYNLREKYPEYREPDLQEKISALVNQQEIKIVVLDDDPTGIQTVHGCMLITSWDERILEAALSHESPLLYILTNSRSLDQSEAIRINREVVSAVIIQNRALRKKLIFVSRSDSTLRGHFPAEPETIINTLKEHSINIFPALFFIPAFIEAGRITAENIHYLTEKEDLVPVAESEFAADSVFGYTQSDLSEYIIEKTGGKVKKGETGSIQLDELRKPGIDRASETIRSLENKKYVIINAIDLADLQKFSLELLQHIAGSGCTAILRTSSTLPKALSGITEKELLKGDDLKIKTGQGLFMIGSHVKKSTAQLNELLRQPGVEGIEVEASRILDDPGYLNEVISELSMLSKCNLLPVIYTSRDEITGTTKAENLVISRSISRFLVDIVRKLPYNPSFLLAKGGITSHDILVHGLHVKQAIVAGQILPGVPVIMTDENHAYPNLPYIIFPGNVGSERSLVEIYRILS